MWYFVYCLYMDDLINSVQTPPMYIIDNNIFLFFKCYSIKFSYGISSPTALLMNT